MAHAEQVEGGSASVQPRPEPVDAEVDRARGALLGTFTGDALGMPFEGAQPTAVPERLEMVDGRLARGSYTDDTQMAVALAESLLERGGIDEGALARAFADAYDPDRGYGQGTTEVLRLVRSGVPAREAAKSALGGKGSLGNGAAMRIAPVAVAYARDAAGLDAAARASALVTHAHPLGVDAAVVQAAAVAAGLRAESPLAAALEAVSTHELRQRLETAARLIDLAPAPADVAEQLGNGWSGYESVPAAVYAATAHDSFEEAVTFAVRCGGDADTIGAMAGAIAGAREGASRIPARWLDALEIGAKGRTYVEALADRLMEVQT